MLIHDSIPVAWSPHNAFSYGCDSNLFLARFDSNTTEPSLKVLTDDIGALMKRRAELGYSLNIKSGCERVWTYICVCADFLFL